MQQTEDLGVTFWVLTCLFLKKESFGRNQRTRKDSRRLHSNVEDQSPSEGTYPLSALRMGKRVTMSAGIGRIVRFPGSVSPGFIEPFASGTMAIGLSLAKREST